MPKALRLPHQHRQAMLDHLLACLPEEGCGLIGGVGEYGCLVVPVSNALHSPVSFSMEPLELLRALTHFEAHDLDVVAIFHSHPAGPARPSPTDVEAFNYPGAVTLIWSPEGDDWQVTAFEISGNDVADISLIWIAGRNESCA